MYIALKNKPKFTCGVDLIISFIVKGLVYIFAISLQTVFNLVSEHFPDKWKQFKICLIFKTGAINNSFVPTEVHNRYEFN